MESIIRENDNALKSEAQRFENEATNIRPASVQVVKERQDDFIGGISNLIGKVGELYHKVVTNNRQEAVTASKILMDRIKATSHNYSMEDLKQQFDDASKIIQEKYSIGAYDPTLDNNVILEFVRSRDAIVKDVNTKIEKRMQVNASFNLSTESGLIDVTKPLDASKIESYNILAKDFGQDFANAKARSLFFKSATTMAQIGMLDNDQINKIPHLTDIDKAYLSSIASRSQGEDKLPSTSVSRATLPTFASSKAPAEQWVANTILGGIDTGSGKIPYTDKDLANLSKRLGDLIAKNPSQDLINKKTSLDTFIAHVNSTSNGADKLTLLTGHQFNNNDLLGIDAGLNISKDRLDAIATNIMATMNAQRFYNISNPAPLNSNDEKILREGISPASQLMIYDDMLKRMPSANTALLESAKRVNPTVYTSLVARNSTEIQRSEVDATLYGIGSHIGIAFTNIDLAHAFNPTPATRVGDTREELEKGATILNLSRDPKNDIITLDKISDNAISMRIVDTLPKKFKFSDSTDDKNLNDFLKRIQESKDPDLSKAYEQYKIGLAVRLNNKGLIYAKKDDDIKTAQKIANDYAKEFFVSKNGFVGVGSVINPKEVLQDYSKKIDEPLYSSLLDNHRVVQLGLRTFGIVQNIGGIDQLVTTTRKDGKKEYYIYTRN